MLFYTDRPLIRCHLSRDLSARREPRIWGKSLLAGPVAHQLPTSLALIPCHLLLQRILHYLFSKCQVCFSSTVSVLPSLADVAYFGLYFVSRSVLLSSNDTPVSRVILILILLEDQKIGALDLVSEYSSIQKKIPYQWKCAHRSPCDLTFLSSGPQSPSSTSKSAGIILPSYLKGGTTAFIVSLPFASTVLHTSYTFMCRPVSSFYLGAESGRVTMFSILNVHILNLCAAQTLGRPELGWDWIRHKESRRPLALGVPNQS